MSSSPSQNRIATANMPQQTHVVQQDGMQFYTGSPSSRPGTYGGVQNQPVIYTSSPKSMAAVCVPQNAPAPQALFDAVDKNHDGVIDRAEMNRFVTQQATNTGSPARVGAPVATNTGSPNHSVALPRWQEWTVTPMKRGAKLGAEFGTVAGAAGSELVVVKVTVGGRLDAWNRERPDKAVKPGDKIVQVNGRRGGSEALFSILQSLRSEDQLEFVVRRGGVGLANPGMAQKPSETACCADGIYGIFRGLFANGH